MNLANSSRHLYKRILLLQAFLALFPPKKHMFNFRHASLALVDFVWKLTALHGSAQKEKCGYNRASHKMLGIFLLTRSEKIVSTSTFVFDDKFSSHVACKFGFPQSSH